MIRALVGHRGTGKSELVKRLQFYLRDENTLFIDLDEEIEKKVGKTIREFFMEQGEEYFRHVEIQLFSEALQRPVENIVIVVGAGFQLQNIPEHVQVLWVKRQTDLEGRIFLDRPRLEAQLSPLEEFQKRAYTRESLYRARADEVYLMPEGVFENRHHAQGIEKALLTDHIPSQGAGMCLNADIFLRESRWSLFKNKFAGRKFAFIELRDDLLSFTEMKRIQDEMPDEVYLYSFRREQDWEHLPPEFYEVLERSQWVDWAFELGSPKRVKSLAPKKHKILSLHEGRYFKEWMEASEDFEHLKLAPLVQNFSELIQYHAWQSESARRRSFLPRSLSGRWEWYRLLQKSDRGPLLRFIREDGGTASDQPSLWKWMALDSFQGSFAALLGSPAHHSLTPIEHSDFFHQRKIPIVTIEVQREEWNEAFPFLTELGLQYAAVTSPLKELAAKAIGEKTLKAVNTLYHSAKEWTGTSTDLQGFLAMMEGAGMIAPLQSEIYVWGGGGTLEMLKQALPRARYFSSRTGLERGTEASVNESPKILVWAAPRDEETKWPPEGWRPQMVFDLNYKEDSMGKEYAQRVGVAYESGLPMFQEQAREQRQFWLKKEESST